MPAPKGIVLASDGPLPGPGAGLGGRPAALLTVANRPLISFALESLSRAGIHDVAIVVDAAACEAVREVVADGGGWDLRVSYLDVRESLGATEGVLAAARFVGRRPFVVLPGHGILRADLEPLIEAFDEERLDALLVTAPERPSALDGVTRRGRRRGAIRLLGTGAGAVATGAGIFRPRVLAAARCVEPSWRGCRELSDALDRLSGAGGRVRAHCAEGWWAYQGRPAELLDANRLVLDEIEPALDGVDLSDADVRGRVAIHPTARLRATVVRGPAVIGPRAHLVDAYVGPYTSIGPDVRLDGAEIENSIVLPGAAVTHVALRLESSVIGRGARVFRDFALPRAMRLRVGDGVEVSVA